MKNPCSGLLAGVRWLLDPLVFPPYCLVGEHLLGDSESLVCKQCLSEIPVTPGNHRPHGWRRSDEALRDVFSYWEFSDSFRVLIHQLKYQHKPKLGILLGKYIAEHLPPNWIQAESRLVPVPLHRTKLRERGYNQAMYIAQGITDATDIPLHSNMLARKKYTRTQTKLSRDQRKANMDDAFITPGQPSSGEQKYTYLLVDDIFTTGSTLGSAARTLRIPGRTSVYGITLGTVPLTP